MTSIHPSKQRCRANPVPQYLDQFETYDPTQKYDHEQLAKIFGKLALNLVTKARASERLSLDMEQKAAALQLQATEARKDRAHTQSRLDQLIFLTEEEDETDTTLQQEVERLQNALDDLRRHTDLTTENQHRSRPADGSTTVTVLIQSIRPSARKDSGTSTTRRPELQAQTVETGTTLPRTLVSPSLLTQQMKTVQPRLTQTQKTNTNTDCFKVMTEPQLSNQTNVCATYRQPTHPPTLMIAVITQHKRTLPTTLHASEPLTLPPLCTKKVMRASDEQTFPMPPLTPPPPSQAI
ncbi:hypothetical protein PO909_013403 [Leuciscus waleckii]